MTVRLRASVIPGMLALTALSMTACASQGTIGAGSPGGTAPGTPGTSGPDSSTSASGSSAPSSGGTDSAPSSADTAAASSPAAPSSEDPSALASSLKTLNQLWTDPGCKTALAGFSDYLYAQQKGELQGVAAIPGAVQKIHQGSLLTKKTNATVAINKLATDMQAMFTQAQHGQIPDKGPVKTDFQIMGNICSEP